MANGTPNNLERIDAKIRAAQPLKYQLIMLHEYDRLLSKKYPSRRKILLPLNLLNLAMQKSLSYWQAWQKQQKHYLSVLPLHKLVNAPQPAATVSKAVAINTTGKKMINKIKGVFLLEKDLNAGNKPANPYNQQTTLVKVA